MSNAALATSATQLAKSTNGEENYDFAKAVRVVAERKVKDGSMTTERLALQRQKLFVGVVRLYKAEFPAIYGKTDTVPLAVENKIRDAVDSEVCKLIASSVHCQNITSITRSFKVRANELRVDEQVNIRGENVLSLEKQKVGITIAIGNANRRMKELLAKPTPDHDAEKKLEEQIFRLENVKTWILKQIADQQTLKSSN